LFKINDQPFRAALNNALASQHAAEGSFSKRPFEIEKFTPLVQNKVISDYQLKTLPKLLMT
jgi:membrane fusion protein (multidrug efflux system)